MTDIEIFKTRTADWIRERLSKAFADRNLDEHTETVYLNAEDFYQLCKSENILYSSSGITISSVKVKKGIGLKRGTWIEQLKNGDLVFHDQKEDGERAR